jgi:hypothetical protein
MREETANILRIPFAAADIDQLPRAGIMLDYVGHAAATARLLDADIEWNWQPMALDDGLPRIIRRDGCLELWITLTIDGTTRIGVGTVADASADQDTAKELIGDAIRNAAMRFGVALDLWRKHDTGRAAPAPSGNACPHCGAPVTFTEDAARHRPGKRDLPFWSCTNRTGCGGGGPRDKDDPSKGNYSWASYNADFFAQQEAEETGGPLQVTRTDALPPPVVGGFDTEDLEATKQRVEAELHSMADLVALGVSREQAEAELEAYKSNSGFAAGHVKDMRDRVNRACVLLVALGLEPEGIQGELWAEWQKADPERRSILTWSTVRGGEVQSFAAHVQAFLRVRG